METVAQKPATHHRNYRRQGIWPVSSPDCVPPFHIGARERRVDNAQRIELTATAPLRLQLDGEYINQCDSLNIRVKQGAVSFAARADDYTEHQFTKKVATRPVDERLLVVVTKKVMDRTRQLFSTSQKAAANPT